MYSNYRGKSIGRILHFVYLQCGLRYAEAVEHAGEGKLNYGGKLFATYTWEQSPTSCKQVVYPRFTFAKEYEFFNRNADSTLKALAMDTVRELEHLFSTAKELLERQDKTNKQNLARVPSEIYLDSYFKEKRLERDIAEFIKNNK